MIKRIRRARRGDGTTTTKRRNAAKKAWRDIPLADWPIHFEEVSWKKSFAAFLGRFSAMERRSSWVSMATGRVTRLLPWVSVPARRIVNFKRRK